MVLLQTDSGPALLEMELIEPPLFLAHSHGAPMRLALVVQRVLDTD